MERPVIGSILVRVGDASILSQARHALIEGRRGGGSMISESGLVRLGELLGEIQACSEVVLGGVGVSDVWKGRET